MITGYKTYTSTNGQSIYDICLHTYGTIDLLLKLMTDNGVASIAPPVPGTVFQYDPALVVDQRLQQAGYTFATGTPYTPPQPPPLDLVPGAFFAHGLRRLSSIYYGKICRLRRSTDNVEMDIGFVGSGILDTATINTFLGSATGYVVKLYDQTGNGHDAAQTTAALQPKISLTESNGKAGVVFTKSSSTVLQVTLTGTRPSNFSLICSYKTTNVNLNSQAACGGVFSTGLNKNLWAIITQVYLGDNVQDGKIQTIIGDNVLNTNVAITTVNKPMANNTYKPVSIRFQNGTVPPSMRVDGIAQALTAAGTGTTCNGDIGNFFIGKANPGTELNGGVLETILYSTYLPDELITALENNTKSFYGI